MTLFTRARHKEGTAGHPRARKAVAIVAALATLSGGAAAVWADDSSQPTQWHGGSGRSLGVASPSGKEWPADIAWIYGDSGTTSDPIAGAFGPAADNPYGERNPSVLALKNLGITVANDGSGVGGEYDGYAKIQAAQAQANQKCVERFKPAYDGEQAQCRIVAVGVIYAPNSPYGNDRFNGSGHGDLKGTNQAARNWWTSVWNAGVAPYEYTHANQPYWTYSKSTASSNSVDDLMTAQLENNPKLVSAIVIALDQHTPQPPTYDLTARTVSSQQGVVKAGGTQAVHDVVESHCASASCASDQTLTATSTLHWKAFDGQTYTLNGQAGRAAAESQKWSTVPVPAAGTPGGQAVLPDFTPADLGMPMWLPGYYWFDFDYAKQSNLANPVHVPGEHDAAESWKALLDLTISTDGSANTGDMTGGGKDSDDTVTDLVTLSCGDSWCPDNQVTVPSVTVMLHDPDGNVNSIVKDVTLGSTQPFTFQRSKSAAAWTAGGYWFEASVSGLDTNVYSSASVSHNTDASVAEESFMKTWSGNADTQASQAQPLVEDPTDTRTMSDTVTARACESTGQGSYCDPVDLTGTLSMTYEPLDGESKTVSKQATVHMDHEDGDKDNPLAGTTDVQFTPSDLGLDHWTPGKYSYDLTIKQADNPILTTDITHSASEDPDEMFYVVPRPSKTWAHMDGTADPFSTDGTDSDSTDSTGSSDQDSTDSADSASSDAISDEDIVDGDWSNQTAGDRDVYADGTRVASVATSDVPLEWLDGGFTLTDDWTAANKVFTADATDADPSKGVSIYVVPGGGSQNPVKDGTDVTGMFDLTVSGSSIKAVTNASYKAPEGATHAQYALVVKGTAKYDTERLAKDANEEMTFCSTDVDGYAVKGNGTDDGQHAFTNIAGTSYTLQDATGTPLSLDTNVPWICGIIPPNPQKDVKYDVTGTTIDGSESVAESSQVVYTLDSGTLDMADRKALGEDWKSMGFTDTLHELDRYDGKWAVYGLTADGTPGTQNLLASDQDTGDTPLFTASYDESTRTLEINATPELVDRLNKGDASLDGVVRFMAAFQVTRIATGEQPNQFTFHGNEGKWDSNTVTTGTHTPTEGLAIEKYDTPSGTDTGDRDTEDQALKMDSDSTQIGVIITNTGTLPLRNLNLTDETLDQTVGQVADWKYPDGWDALVLNPGDSVTVTGTLSGVTPGSTHHDRATVTGDPVPECHQKDDNPWDDTVSVESCECMPDGSVTITDGTGVPTQMSVGTDAGPIQGCEQPRVLTASDDWWGKRPALPGLPDTGSAVMPLVILGVALLAGGTGLAVWSRRRRPTAAPAGDEQTPDEQ